MADSNKNDTRQANPAHASCAALDSLCDAFERTGYHRDKRHAADYTKLVDASVLMFGSPNDPLSEHTKVNPDEGKEILRGLQVVFDNVSTAEARNADSALLFKQGHRDKAAAFAGFSTQIDTVLQSFPKP